MSSSPSQSRRESPAVRVSWGQKQLTLNYQLSRVYSQSLTLPTTKGIICNENPAKPTAIMEELGLTHLLQNKAGWPSGWWPSSSGLECHRIEIWVPTSKMFSLTTFLTPNVWAFSSHQSTPLQIPSGCPTIQFNSNTNYMESTENPEVKGSALQDCLAHFRHQMQVQATCIVTKKL